MQVIARVKCRSRSFRNYASFSRKKIYQYFPPLKLLKYRNYGYVRTVYGSINSKKSDNTHYTDLRNLAKFPVTIGKLHQIL